MPLGGFAFVAKIQFWPREMALTESSSFQMFITLNQTSSLQSYIVHC